MPRFSGNPAKSTLSNFSVIDEPGVQELIIIGVKSFYNKKEVENKLTQEMEDKSNYGVMFMFQVAEGTHKDKKLAPYYAYQHSQGAQDFSKGFIMAVYGYDLDDKGQADFNAFAEAQDWGMDTDTGAVGDGYANMKGRRVNAELGIDMTKPNDPNKTPQMVQKFNKFWKF